MLVSSNLAVVGMSTVAALIAVQMNGALLWSPWVVSGLSAFASLLVVLFSEIAPKLAAKRNPERAATLTLPMLNLLESALGPMIRQLVNLIGWVTRPFGGGQGEGMPTVTEEELVHMVDEGTRAGALEPEESAMIQSVIAFGDTVVREVMVPRPDIVSIGADETVEAVLERALEVGFSRMPVVEQQGDDVVGVAYTKDMIRTVRMGRGEDPVRSHVRVAHFVPETKRVSDLMREMQAQTFHLAMVVDEYGGTAGLVTLEDLIEELVGEIVDEFDVE